MALVRSLQEGSSSSLQGLRCAAFRREGRGLIRGEGNWRVQRQPSSASTAVFASKNGRWTPPHEGGRSSTDMTSPDTGLFWTRSPSSPNYTGSSCGAKPPTHAVKNRKRYIKSRPRSCLSLINPPSTTAVRIAVRLRRPYLGQLPVCPGADDTVYRADRRPRSLLLHRCRRIRSPLQRRLALARLWRRRSCPCYHHGRVYGRIGCIEVDAPHRSAQFLERLRLRCGERTHTCLVDRVRQ